MHIHFSHIGSAHSANIQVLRGCRVLRARLASHYRKLGYILSLFVKCSNTYAYPYMHPCMHPCAHRTLTHAHAHAHTRIRTPTTPYIAAWYTSIDTTIQLGSRGQRAMAALNKPLLFSKLPPEILLMLVRMLKPAWPTELKLVVSVHANNLCLFSNRKQQSKHVKFCACVWVYQLACLCLCTCMCVCMGVSVWVCWCACVCMRMWAYVCVCECVFEGRRRRQVGVGMGV